MVFSFSGTYTLVDNLLRITFTDVQINDPSGDKPLLRDKIVNIRIQNDELTMRFANGNDLWLHVGGGRPGSHVVVRLPKQKTASLETLLDAAALAVHYSKARGEPRIDVIYTHRKHVKKPKGLPPGAVVPAQTKTITVLHDAARLGRVLDTAAGE